MQSVIHELQLAPCFIFTLFMCSHLALEGEQSTTSLSNLGNGKSNCTEGCK